MSGDLNDPSVRIQSDPLDNLQIPRLVSDVTPSKNKIDSDGEPIKGTS